MTTKTKIIIGAGVASVAGFLLYLKLRGKTVKVARKPDGSVGIVVECNPVNPDGSPSACSGEPASDGINWLTSDAPSEYLTMPLYKYFP